MRLLVLSLLLACSLPASAQQRVVSFVMPPVVVMNRSLPMAQVTVNGSLLDGQSAAPYATFAGPDGIWHLRVADPDYVITSFSFSFQCSGQDVSPKYLILGDSLAMQSQCSSGGRIFFDDIILEKRTKAPKGKSDRFNIGLRSMTIKKEV